MPMAPDQLAKYREMLMDKRESLVGQVENLAKDLADSTVATESSKVPLNLAENASDTYEQDFAFMSMESEEDLLRMIEAALRRIREGTYGKCGECGEEIKTERLEALPFADMCVKCQQLEERGARRNGGGDFEMPDDDLEGNTAGDDNA